MDEKTPDPSSPDSYKGKFVLFFLKKKEQFKKKYSRKKRKYTSTQKFSFWPRNAFKKKILIFGYLVRF